MHGAEAYIAPLMKSHTHNFAAHVSPRARAIAVRVETSQAVIAASSLEWLVLDRESMQPCGGGAMD